MIFYSGAKSDYQESYQKEDQTTAVLLLTIACIFMEVEISKKDQWVICGK